MAAVPPLTSLVLGASSVADINYLQVAGNRFARRLADVPARMAGDSDRANPEALIGVLVPEYTSLFATEVLGLHLALARPPVTIELEMRRLNGQSLRCELPFADELSALVLKSLATTVRSKDTDIADVWRCLEIASAAGLGPEAFTSGIRAKSAEVIRTLFSSRHGPPVASLAAEQRLPAQAADERYTRIPALIARVVGSGRA